MICIEKRLWVLQFYHYKNINPQNNFISFCPICQVIFVSNGQNCSFPQNSLSPFGHFDTFIFDYPFFVILANLFGVFIGKKTGKKHKGPTLRSAPMFIWLFDRQISLPSS